MGPDKRDAAGAQVRPGRIPVPPLAIPEASKAQPVPAKSGIPSPRRRTISGITRLKDVVPATTSSLANVASTTSATAKRTAQTTMSKITKSLLRPSSVQVSDDKDDIRQRDNIHKDVTLKKDNSQRDKPVKDVGLRRPSSAADAGQSAPDSGKRVIKQPSLLLKSSVTGSMQVPASSSCASKASTASPAAPAATAAKPMPRSVSTCRDRLSNDTRTSMMRRSMSVGKGRAIAAPTDHFPQQQAGAKMRPILERPASAGGAAHRLFPDKRDASAGRLRPASAGGKVEGSLPNSVKPALQTIVEAPARPSALSAGGTAPVQPKSTPTRPPFSLNLAALKQHSAAAAASAAPPAPTASTPPPPTAEASSSLSAEDSGPPVPKLDLGGILQRRAEEQASEPVFMVAASNEETGPVSASGSLGGQPDKRKSGSRQPSAKEEPAEHFYLYPKVQPQEKKRIEDICRVVPRKQQAAITDLFSKMVEARQNCEQMCFRGHRLLDQAQAEFRNRLAQKEEEVAQKEEELTQWRNEAEYLRAQLGILLGAQQAGEPANSGHDHAEAEARDEERAMILRNSLLSTFDSMALLGSAPMMAEAATDATAMTGMAQAGDGEAQDEP